MSKIQEMRKRFLEGLHHVLEEAKHGLSEEPSEQPKTSSRRQEFVFDTTPDEELGPRIDREVDPVAEGMAESAPRQWKLLVAEPVAGLVPVTGEGRDLRAMLRDRKSLRQAILLKEILDKPVSQRRRG